MIRSGILAFVIVICLTAVAVGQGVSGYEIDTTQAINLSSFTWDIVGGGTRAQGMGNAYIALSDDVSAGSWNPAGLMIQEKPVLGFSWGAFYPRGDYTGLGVALDQTDRFDKLNYASFIAPIRIKGHPFVGGISYTRNFEEYVNGGGATDYIFLNAFDDTAFGDVNVLTDYHAVLNSINFSAGTRVYGQWNMGVGLNIYTGEAIVNQSTRDLLSNYVPIEKAPQHVEALTAIDLIDTINYSGVNFTIGVKRDGERFDFGLVVRTPFSLSYDLGRSVYTLVSYNGAPQGQFSDTTFLDENKIKYEMPMFIGAGIAYNATKDLIVATDFEYRPFSSSKVKVMDSVVISPSGDNEEFFTPADPNWENSFAFRFGLENTFHTGKSIAPNVPVRAGFGVMTLPRHGVDASGNADKVTRLSLSVGTGIHWTYIYLDAAYTYSKHDLTNELAAQELRFREHQLNLMFTGYF